MDRVQREEDEEGEDRMKRWTGCRERRMRRERTGWRDGQGAERGG